MDPLSHSLVGVATARLVAPASKVGAKAALWTALIAANVPDLDVLLWAFFGEHGFIMEHRGFTHSLLGLLVLTFAVGLLSARLFKAQLLPLTGLAAACVAGHIALDMVSGWGVMLLYPFDRMYVGAPWLFPIDPWLWALLAAGLFVVGRKSPARGAVVALGLAVAYIGLNATASVVAAGQGEALAAKLGGEARVAAYPVGMNPLERSVIVTEGNFSRQLYTGLFSEATEPRKSWVRNREDPSVKHALESGAGKRFARWASDDVVARVTVDKEGEVTVELFDLRFWSPASDAPVMSMELSLERVVNQADPANSGYKVAEWAWKTRGLAPLVPVEL